MAPQAGLEPATLRLTAGKDSVSRPLPHFAGSCWTLRSSPKNQAVFRFRLVPAFAALCRSLLLRKGKKRATSQSRSLSAESKSFPPSKFSGQIYSGSQPPCQVLLAGGAERQLEMKPLGSLEVVDHFEEITGLRVAAWTEHAH